MAWRETKHHPVLAEFSLPRNWWPSRPRSMRYDGKAMLEAYNLGSTRYTHFERDAAQQLSTCMDAAYMMILQPPWWMSARIISQLLGICWLAALGVCGCTTKPPRPIVIDPALIYLPALHNGFIYPRAMRKTTRQHGRPLKRAGYLDQIQQAECAAQANRMR